MYKTFHETFFENLQIIDLSSSPSARVPGVLATSWREAMGVAALIVHWNAPVALGLRALGPAFAAGYMVAVKLPGQTADQLSHDAGGGRDQEPSARRGQHLHRVW